MYNSKADIWALGCIFHELFYGVKMFSSDWAVLQVVGNNDSIEITGNSQFLAPFQNSNLIDNMLRILPSSRPTADAVLESLEELAVLVHAPLPRNTFE